MQFYSRYTRWLWLILIVGLALRIIYALSQPTVELFYGADGGDGGWYLANGWGFFSGQPHGWIRNVPFYLSALPTAPFYILYAGFFQQFLGEHEVIVVMRLLQCFAGIGTAYMSYRIALVIRKDERVALVTGSVIALNPAFIVEPANIATETFYIFFLVMGLWLYIEHIVVAILSETGLEYRYVVLVGLAFGMATLTRAVFLLFPIGIILHMGLLGYRNYTSLWLRVGTILFLVYMAIVSTWTFYNLGMWGRLVIGSDQLMPALWRGAVQNDGNPDENDALLLENPDDVRPKGCEVDCKYQHSTEVYVEQISESIGGNIGTFVVRRLRELFDAYLLPHGTTPFGRVSVRDEIADWFTNQRSLEGFIQLFQIEGFFVKLVVWGLHYVGIVLGIIGMLLMRRQWRLTLPLIGFIVYTTLVHFVLLALPRYIFPIEVPFTILASVTFVMMIDRLRLIRE